VRRTTRGRTTTRLDKAIGKNIKSSRDAAREAATDCAAVLDASLDDYEAIEAGQMRCGAENLVKLATYLKVPVSGFFKGIEVVE
jgi:hypothetical protein